VGSAVVDAAHVLTDTVETALSGYSERPTSGIGSAFRLAWTKRITTDQADGTLVLPDGAADILWMDGELVVAGPDRFAKREWTVPGSTIFGLRFARGAGSTWLGIEMRDLVGLRVPLADIVGRRRANELAEPLRAIDDATLLSAAMERAFQGMADPGAARFATTVIGVLNQAPIDAAVIPSAMQVTGLSERTLRRRCDQIFGYGPRTLARILRLQRLLGLLRTDPKLTLATAAAVVGFADQSHMTREVRSLTTLAPTTLSSLVAR